MTTQEEIIFHNENLRELKGDIVHLKEVYALAGKNHSFMIEGRLFSVDECAPALWLLIENLKWSAYQLQKQINELQKAEMQAKALPS